MLDVWEFDYSTHTQPFVIAWKVKPCYIATKYVSMLYKEESPSQLAILTCIYKQIRGSGDNLRIPQRCTRKRAVHICSPVQRLVKYYARFIEVMKLMNRDKT